MDTPKNIAFFLAATLALGGLVPAVLADDEVAVPAEAEQTEEGAEPAGRALFSLPENSADEAAPAPVPAAPVVKTVSIRYAYWKRPSGSAPELFYKEGNEFKKLPPFPVMAFGSEPLVYHGVMPIKIFSKGATREDGVVFVSESGEEYTYLFSIDPQEKSEIGAVVLPGAIEDKKQLAVLVFDWNLDRFPYDTVCLVNFSGCDVSGTITPRSKEPVSFEIEDGKAFVSPKFPAGRTVYDIQLDAQNGEKTQTLFSSGSAFVSGMREMFFIVPKSGILPEEGVIPKVEFRSIKDRKPAEKK